MEPDKFVKDIRTGVALVLKSWMANHPKDFSERLIEKLRDFVENRLVKDGRTDLAKTLRSPLTKLVKTNLKGSVQKKTKICSFCFRWKLQFKKKK